MNGSHIGLMKTVGEGKKQKTFVLRFVLTVANVTDEKKKSIRVSERKH